jgi:hypothetical protein
MALYTQLKQDLKKKLPLVQTAIHEGTSRGANLLGNFTKQLNGYEKRVKNIVIDLEKEAKTLGKERLEKFVTHLRETRTNMEKTVTNLVQDERKRLNSRLDDLLGFLNKTEKKAAPRKKTVKKTSTRKSTVKKRATV